MFSFKAGKSVGHCGMVLDIIVEFQTSGVGPEAELGFSAYRYQNIDTFTPLRITKARKMVRSSVSVRFETAPVRTCE